MLTGFFAVSVVLALLSVLKTKTDSSFNRWDFIFLLAGWQMFDLGVWTKTIPSGLICSYHMAAALLIALTLWYIYRRGIQLGRLGFSLIDLKDVGVSLTILAMILIPLGIYLRFLKFNFQFAFPKFIIVVLKYTLFVAVVEELTFRGLLQNLLVRRFFSSSAIFITNLFFALMYTHLFPHGVGFNWQYPILAFIAGIVYSVSYEKSRNILVPIAVHGLTDAIHHIF